MQLHRVHVGTKSLADYASIQGPEVMVELRERAARLRGLRMLHVSATAYGGGVAEIMYTLVPLLCDAGVECEWRIMHSGPDLFQATKQLHNALQGDPTGLTAAQVATWRRYNQINADELRTSLDEYDVVVIHDPQPALMALGLGRGRAKLVWRCHIDLSEPNREVLDLLAPALAEYDAAIFHTQAFVPTSIPLRQPVVWPPAIDPLAPKNMPLGAVDAGYIVRQFGVKPERRLMLQVSRFDPWKDPLGVIDAFRQLRGDVDGLQLALVGSLADDDPEGLLLRERVFAYADGDDDILVLSNMESVGAIEVNAFQCTADVIVQKSLKEGFGLTVTEALWKGRPVVAGNVGGIRDQIQDRVTGHLVSSVSECAQRCREVLEGPITAGEMALSGKEHVRQRFLTPRLVRDWLRLSEALRDGAAYPAAAAGVA
jgi:trehalose synthase